jgi:serine/threonine protein kinase
MSQGLLEGSGTMKDAEQFGPYRIVKLLGKGGMGSVYLAQDTRLERPVALKVPQFTAQDGPEVVERFYREARSAATLDHPNLCPVYDVGEIDGTPFLAMRYLDGKPLSAIIKDGKPLGQRQAAALVGKVALGVQAAHGKGVIHRDLKPANIMIVGGREPIIMDFGLARRAEPGEARITQTGTILGTPGYMAPEQAAGKTDEIGPATDIYALGVILYELLTGKLPFEGPIAVVLAQVLAVEPPSLATLRPDLEPQIVAICQQAMAKKPAERFRTMSELAAALLAFVRSASVAGVSESSVLVGRASPGSGHPADIPAEQSYQVKLEQAVPHAVRETHAGGDTAPIKDSASRRKEEGTGRRRKRKTKRRKSSGIVWAAAGAGSVLLLGAMAFAGFWLWKSGRTADLEEHAAGQQASLQPGPSATSEPASASSRPDKDDARPEPAPAKPVAEPKVPSPPATPGPGGANRPAGPPQGPTPGPGVPPGFPPGFQPGFPPPPGVTPGLPPGASGSGMGPGAQPGSGPIARPGSNNGNRSAESFRFRLVHHDRATTKWLADMLGPSTPPFPGAPGAAGQQPPGGKKKSGSPKQHAGVVIEVECLTPDKLFLDSEAVTATTTGGDEIPASVLFVAAGKEGITSVIRRGSTTLQTGDIILGGVTYRFRVTATAPARERNLVPCLLSPRGGMQYGFARNSKVKLGFLFEESVQRLTSVTIQNQALSLRAAAPPVVAAAGDVYRFDPQQQVDTPSRNVTVFQQDDGKMSTSVLGDDGVIGRIRSGPNAVTFVPDVHGSTGLHVVVNHKLGYTTAAGLRFQQDVVMNIWDDGVVEIDKAGVQAADAKGVRYVSQQRTIGDRTGLVMVKGGTSTAAPPEASDEAHKEKRAANKLKLAKELLESGSAKGRQFLEEVIKDYPMTKAAAEARTILEKLKAK